MYKIKLYRATYKHMYTEYKQLKCLNYKSALIKITRKFNKFNVKSILGVFQFYVSYVSKNFNFLLTF